jgi:hypothetical protein
MAPGSMVLCGTAPFESPSSFLHLGWHIFDREVDGKPEGHVAFDCLLAFMPSLERPEIFVDFVSVNRPDKWWDSLLSQEFGKTDGFSTRLCYKNYSIDKWREACAAVQWKPGK